MTSNGPILTLFTTVKPFQGPFATLQRDALRSWAALPETADVLVFGDEPGTAETAEELGVRALPVRQRNDFGMPLVRALFEQASQIATTPYLCYANADIVLMCDFVAAVRRAASYTDRFLMIGQRMDVDNDEAIDFACGWQERLRQRVVGSRYSLCRTGLDYFVFPKALWTEIPDALVVGRGGWDHWPVYAARLHKAMVIDATEVVMAIHRRHDYSHHPQGVRGVYAGVEAERNSSILGAHNTFSCLDATHLMTHDAIRMRCRSCCPVCVCQPESFY